MQFIPKMKSQSHGVGNTIHRPMLCLCEHSSSGCLWPSGKCMECRALDAGRGETNERPCENCAAQEVRLRVITKGDELCVKLFDKASGKSAPKRPFPLAVTLFRRPLRRVSRS